MLSGVQEPSRNITELLASYGRGNKESLDQLMPVVYDELRRQAARYLRREQAGHTLQTTALIHEAYVRLVIEGGAAKQLTHFEDSKIFSFSWMKDGSVVASRGVITSDVVLINDATR